MMRERRRIGKEEGIRREESGGGEQMKRRADKNRGERGRKGEKRGEER